MIDNDLLNLNNPQVDLENFEKDLMNSIENIDTSISVDEFGLVHSISDGIATISGLANVALEEVVRFGDSGIGIVKELLLSEVKAILIEDFESVKEGDVVKRTYTDFKVPVSENLIGRVVNIFGQSIDGMGDIDHSNSVLMPIEAPATKMIDRQPITEPLSTGIIVIDAMIPIGEGQRELILGDRQTGKTTIAISSIINQRYRYDEGNPIYCVYVAIGQKTDSIIQVHNKLKEAGAMQYTTIVSVSASDSAAAQFIAPYTGCAIAEYFMQQGKSCLIVYDDLSKHAVAYREISRLLGRPAGRDAFPADSFYIHARLLERAACLSDKVGGGTMTALPIIETQDGDISSFIATNVISITDGQLFLDANEFYAQQRPAVKIGLSVSRVGSSAQIAATKKTARSMKSELAQYAELEKFVKFTGGTVDKVQERILERGRQTKCLICQEEDELYTLTEQVILISGSHYGLFKNIATHERKAARAIKAELLDIMYKQHPKIIFEIESSRNISDESLSVIREVTHKLVGIENE